MAMEAAPAAFLSNIANGSVSDEAIYIITLGVSLGFSLALRRIETEFARKLFSLVFGVVYCGIALGYNLAHSFLTVFVVGLILFFVPRFTHRNFIAILFIWIHLIYIRLYTTNRGVANACQLIMTLRLTSLCWDCQDSYHSKKKESEQTQETERLPSVPQNVFDYISYAYFLPGLLTGPFFTYDDYFSSIDDAHLTCRDPVSTKKGEPSTFDPYWWRRFASCVPYLIGFLLFERFLPFSFVKTEAYLNLSFPQRLFYYILSAYSLRLKFYFVWTAAESACIAARVSYPFNLQTIDVYQLETSTSPADFTKFWNMSVVRFLFLYVKQRIPSFIPKSAHVWMVFFVTSLWHGVHPVYYLSFGIGALWVTASSSLVHMSGKLLPPSDRPAWMRHTLLVVCFLLTHLELNFAGGLFSILDFPVAFRVMGSLYYFGVLGPIVFIMMDIVWNMCEGFWRKSNSRKPLSSTHQLAG